MYDYVIVGSGFFGATCAYELNKKGYKVCVIDRRNHIGGNCYTEDKDGIPVLMYGPQVFHTPNKSTWEWINQFSEFNQFKLSPVSLYDGKFYSFPINMWTFYQIHGTAYPAHINGDVLSRIEIQNPTNLEEQLIKNVGHKVYEMLCKGFLTKYWGKTPNELSVDLIKQFPTKLTYNNQYYENEFEGMPIDGYNTIFNKLLEGIEVRLNTDIFKDNLPPHNKLIYTGPIDRYFDYKHGRLNYRSFNYKHKSINTQDHQGNALVYFNGRHIPYTRIIESKHFFNKKSYNTWISWEYPVDTYIDETELMLPVEDAHSNEIYKYYQQETQKLQNVIFGGKLATYKNLSIAETIESAIELVNDLSKTKEIKKNNMENTDKKLMVIINHFQNDISWAKRLKHPYIIYNKNPEETHLFDVNLPNLGFDTIVYLRFIVDNYNNLPDYMCFLQDDPFYHCGNCVEIVNEFDFSKPFYPMSHTYFLANHEFERTYEYAHRINLEYKNPIKMIASCQCIVSKELVLKTSKEMYEKIIETIADTVKSSDNYCIENLWPTILNFNEELIPSCDYCIGYGGPC